MTDQSSNSSSTDDATPVSTPKPAASPSEATQARATLSTPFVMHTKPAMILGILIVTPIAILVGYWIGNSVIGGERLTFSPNLLAFVVGLTLVLTVLLGSSNKRFVIDSDRVRQIGPFGKTMKTHAINGVDDLMLDRNRVRRVSDGKAVAAFNPIECNAGDIATLRAGIPKK